MNKYIDLGSLIDVEPPVSEVLALVEDEALQNEFYERLDEDFFREFINGYCKEYDIVLLKEIIDEAYGESTED